VRVLTVDQRIDPVRRLACGQKQRMAGLAIRGSGLSMARRFSVEPSSKSRRAEVISMPATKVLSPPRGPDWVS